MSPPITDERFADAFNGLPKIYSKIANLSLSKKKLKQFLKRGLPRQCQPLIWNKIAGVSELKSKMQPYQYYVSHESSFDTQIEKDVPRTFPEKAVFLNLHDELFRILHALSVYLNDYTQGISYVTGFILLNVQYEEECFYLVCRLFEKYQLKELYSVGFSFLHQEVFVFETLFSARLPALRQHFKNLHVPTSVFLHRWFLTLFTMEFPFELVSRIFDVFILQKWRVILKVSLQLLIETQDQLLNMDYEQLLYFLQKMDQIFDEAKAPNGKVIPIGEFFDRAMKLDIKKSMNRATKSYKKLSKKRKVDPL